MAQESWKKETDETECQTPKGPILCANNCGFFGSAATNNLCSKCHGDLFMKQQPKQKLRAAPVIPLADKMPISSTLVQHEPVVEKVDSMGEGCGLKEGSSSSREAANQPLNRCMCCRKRVGLTGFKCRCGRTFCAVHRHSEKHECSFDYRSTGRDAIAKANPVVKAEKIEKI
ncbi:hypothetical protein NE237_009156 [Protea cynaroides]|uniref:Uncharacterized protein n=1 Tax=Protea cynaroides TaxID=273540 RepID=A0A9Q0KXT2_9MAGN|nr:hypothetical protein NE237_009156 [Protea cynaroides]